MEITKQMNLQTQTVPTSFNSTQFNVFGITPNFTNINLDSNELPKPISLPEKNLNASRIVEKTIENTTNSANSLEKDNLIKDNSVIDISKESKKKIKSEEEKIVYDFLNAVLERHTLKSEHISGKKRLYESE